MADVRIEVCYEGCAPEAYLIKWKVKPGSKINQGTVLLLYDDKMPNGSTESMGNLKKLKASVVGSVTRLLKEEGEKMYFGSPVLYIKGCAHPVVMKDMCAECGADLRETNDEQNKPLASVAMVHSVPELVVSDEQAQILGKADELRLLCNRKLVLLVDLDQTLIHTTNDDVPPNLKDVYHFQLHGYRSQWYHARIRPGTRDFLERISNFYELHICTFGARQYAHTVTRFLDEDGRYFSHRILSRDECFSSNSKTANLRALFPCGDKLVCIIDDREDVWNFVPNLVHVKPYHFFQHTGDINAPRGLGKLERDVEEGSKYFYSKKAKNTKRLKKKRKMSNIDDNSCDNEKVDSNDSKLSKVSSISELTKDDDCGNHPVCAKESEIHKADENISIIVKNKAVSDDCKSCMDVDLSPCGSKPNNTDSNIKVCEGDKKGSTLETDDTVHNVFNKKNVEQNLISNEEDSTVKEEEIHSHVEFSPQETCVIISNISDSDGDNEITKNDDGNEKVNQNKDGDDKIKQKNNSDVNVSQNEGNEDSDDKIKQKNNSDVNVSQNEGNEDRDDKIKQKNNSDVNVSQNERNEDRDDKIKQKNNSDVNVSQNEGNEDMEDKIKQKNNSDVNVSQNEGNEDRDDKIKQKNNSDVNVSQNEGNEDRDDKIEQKGSTGANVNRNERSDDKVKENEEKDYKVKENEDSEDSNDLLVVEDGDDYLMYLSDILITIHKAFYEMYDKIKQEADISVPQEIPDLKRVIPYVRRKVLKGVRILFSGVVPTNLPLEKNRIFHIARSLGAEIQTQLVPRKSDKDGATTHVVAARLGTVKVNEAKRCRGVHIVTPEWLWCCAERWERVNERLFPLTKETTFESKLQYVEPMKTLASKFDTGVAVKEMQNVEVTPFPTYDPVTGKRINRPIATNDADISASCSQKRSNLTQETDAKTLQDGSESDGNFATSLNPLLSFSTEDIAKMDQEVEDILDSLDSDEEESEGEITKKLVLGKKRQRESDAESSSLSSSSESLTGEHPRGWSMVAKRRKTAHTSDVLGYDSNDSDLENSDYPRDSLRKHSEASGDERMSDDDFDTSVGSVDEEMAAAVEREFLGL